MRSKQLKLTPLIILVLLTAAFFIGSNRQEAPLATVSPAPAGQATAAPIAPESTDAPARAARPTASPRPGDREAVAAYIAENGRLPDYYMTKAEARRLGWTGGSLEAYAPGRLIGGDRFGNLEGRLPDQPGRVYYECDIGTLGSDSRGARRIVYSNDGLIYYTDDHYESFTRLTGGQ